MKLATFLAPGGEAPLGGLVQGARVSAFAEGVGVLDVLAGVAPGELGENSWSLAEVTLLAPVPHPGTIYAIGMNYARHIQEIGMATPEAPVVFVNFER